MTLIPYSERTGAMKKTRFWIVVAIAACLALLTACGGEPEPPKVLNFTQMEVSTDTRTGFFGGRYASFKVTGSVTNNTGNPVNVDNIPVLTWDNEKLKAETSQEKLLDGETCDVTWEKEISFKGSDIPELSFSGSVEFAGLDDCQTELNEQLQAIASGFADKDAEEEAARKKREQEAEEARKQAEQEAEEARQKEEADKAALTACKGKSASEAKKVASGTDYKPIFKDSYDVDVTSDITDTSDAGLATVTKVTIENGGFFPDPKVTFTLDYTDPAAKAERDKKEKEEVARKQAEEEAQAKREQLKDDIKACKGQSVTHAYKLIKDSGFTYEFCLPSDNNKGYGEDITDDVKDPVYKGARKRTKVTDVTLSGNEVRFIVERPLAITIEDNEELRAVLQVKDNFDPSVGAFAEKYAGKNIEFDGCISSVYMEYETEDPRFRSYTALVEAMDYDPNKAIGPSFQIKDRRVSMLHWVGEAPTTLDEGQNIHIVAQLGSFNETNGLYQLYPLMTSMR